MTGILDIQNQLERAKAEGLAALRAAADPRELYEIRTDYLGKKGKVKAVLRGLGQLPPEERPKAGQLANEAADELEALYQSLLAGLKDKETLETLRRDAVDVTLPGIAPRKGAVHPLSQTLYEIEELFYSMGYDIAEGPEIETDYYNFEMLNFPPNHPARDMQDTFFTKSGHVLRTHTSPVQIRYMRCHEPPIRMIAPGRVYRCDSDVTHSPIFHQIEGLVVGEDVSFRGLRGVLEQLIHHFFPAGTKVRFRPSFFPFTEPSAEVDIAFRGKGGSTDWMEVLGCGMVHPNVLRNGGYDPEVYTGFAFGLGVERFAMIKYGIRDIRLLYENDIRFLSQFR